MGEVFIVTVICLVGRAYISVGKVLGGGLSWVVLGFIRSLGRGFFSRFLNFVIRLFWVFSDFLVVSFGGVGF